MSQEGHCDAAGGRSAVLVREMTPYYEREGVVLYHGDCREVMAGLEAVDHVITDPPYARDVYVRMTGNNGAVIDAAYKGPGVARMAAGAIGAVDELREPVARELGRLVRRWAIVFSDAETAHEWRELLDSNGLRFARTGAWVKPDAMPQLSGDRPGVGFEPCTIAHAKGPMRWNGGGGLAVWTHFTSKGAARPDHPCPKPLPLMLELIEDFTDSGELIMDPFAGSGTTGVAAFQLGRRAILIEKEEKWCQVTAKRLEGLTKPLPLVIEQFERPSLALPSDAEIARAR